MMLLLGVLIALALDKVFAEPKRYHPLVYFGRWADALEVRFNQTRKSKLYGLIAVLLAIIPWLILAILLDWYLIDYVLIHAVVSAVILYISIGWQSLISHAHAIKTPLKVNDLATARQALAMIVSRDASELGEKDIAKAATESVLENGSDVIFSAVFWFVLFGIPGAVLYRLSNTLDAMWGYKNQRFLYFGWSAARLDDVLNFVPVRLTAISYAIAGHFNLAIHYWWAQAFGWKSPNAGPVMAAGAGALNVCLGGSARYHGKDLQRPVLGLEETEQAQAGFNSICQACNLVNKALIIWVIAIVVFRLLL